MNIRIITEEEKIHLSIKLEEALQIQNSLKHHGQMIQCFFFPQEIQFTMSKIIFNSNISKAF